MSCVWATVLQCGRLVSHPNKHKQTQTAAALDVEIQRLQAEVAEYEHELGEVKNQDITLRKLEETVRAYEAKEAAQVCGDVHI